MSATPVDVIRSAKSAGILQVDDEWIALVRNRNITSHTYDDAQAMSIYIKIKDIYAPMFRKFIESHEKSA